MLCRVLRVCVCLVPFRELELRHHALGTPCAWPALNLLCNLTNGRARRHRWVTSETRKHKSTCGKAGDSLLSFRTALSVCLVYSVCLLHFQEIHKPAYDKTLHWLHLHCTMSMSSYKGEGNHRSASTEPLSQSAEVQDAHAEASCVANQVQGLVCHDRSERRILPRIHPSVSQEVPKVRFWGQSIPISVLPFGLALSPRTFTKVVDAVLAPLRLQGIRY